MTPRPPGDLLPSLARLDKFRAHGWRMAELPRNAQDELHAFLSDCRHYVARDPSGAIRTEQILDRIDTQVDAGTLGAISAADLRALKSWLLALPTTVRRAG